MALLSIQALYRSCIGDHCGGPRCSIPKTRNSVLALAKLVGASRLLRLRNQTGKLYPPRPALQKAAKSFPRGLKCWWARLNSRCFPELRLLQAAPVDQKRIER